MPIRSIDKIKIGNYPQGQFAGGYVYSLQFNQGYAESVNELTIDIVFDKNTPINLPEKNLTTSYRIEIGDLVIPFTYFIEHGKDVSSSENVLRCKFIDSSFLLDKYYVGLTNRHYKVKESSATFGVNVYCTDCDQRVVPVYDLVGRSIVKDSPNLLINNLLVVGEEEFVEQTCDVPDVKYNFTNLLSTMNKIPNFSYQGFLDINSKYKTSYIGTLREVLSNWCSDFGFSFYWDFLTNKLIAIDLRNPVDLTPVQNFINQNFSQDSNLPISNYSEEESLLGTYQQDNIDYILKPARAKSREFKDFWTINYSPVTINDAFFSLGLDKPDAVSCLLAKYNSQARTLYNLQSAKYSKVGFQSIYTSIPTYLLQSCFKNVYDFSLYNNAGAAIRIGYYDEGKHDAETEKESLIADSIGRYYKNNNYINFTPPRCAGDTKLAYTAEYYPSPIEKVPFADAGGNPIRPVPQGWFIERNPTYYHTSNLDVGDLGPIFINIDGELADQVRDTIILNEPNNFDPDKYRGLTLIAWKPYLSVKGVNNTWNGYDENFVPEQFEQQATSCETFCNRDLVYEVCRPEKFGCKNLLTPAHGLVSKLSYGVHVINLINGSYSFSIFPSEQPYQGYAKAEGAFEWTEFSVKNMNQITNFQADPNVLEYSINLNDITTEEPSQGQIAWQNQTQSSLGLDVKQKKLKKKISLKIIGANYGNLASYLNPSSGLVGFNLYINDQGIFSDLTFENRPERKPKPEVVMQKVGPQKIRVLK